MSSSSSNWGRWGSEDERGALNLLTPECLLAALRVSQSGAMYQLGLPVQKNGVPNVDYRNPPQRLTLLNQSDESMLVSYGGVPGTGSNEDVVVMATHSVTHMDALSHVYQDSRMYNGFGHDSFTANGGASRCGIEKAGPLITRGVLLDVAAHAGVAALEPGSVISAADLAAVAESQGTEIRPGDAVLIRTGWLEEFERTGQMDFNQPGIGHEAAVHLAEKDIVAVGSDNTALEAMPFPPGDFMPVHIEMLNRHGIYLLEHLVLAELASDRCLEFLLIVVPLPITGATGSPVNPIAIG